MLFRIRKAGACAAAAFGLLLSTNALACMCIRGDGPDELVANVPILFAGTLERTEPCPGSARLTCGTFSVNEVFKGKIGDTITLQYEAQDGFNCGPVFRIGASHLVAAGGDLMRGYFANGCDQSGLDLTGYYDAHLQAARRYRVTLDALDAMLANAPDDVRLLTKKATLLVDKKAIDEGFETLDRLLKISPNNQAALRLKARLLVLTKKDAEAATILNALPTEGGTADSSEQQRIEALLVAGRIKEIPESWLDFAGMSLDYVDFSGRQLNGGAFEGARLAGAKFLSAQLEDAVFSRTNLNDATFEGAKLSGASFVGATLGAKFAGSVLRNADLDRSTGQPDFSQADLGGALLLSVDFGKANFNSAKMAGAVLTGGRFQRADFSDADLAGADLSYAAFDGSYFIGASLRDANLTGASFLGIAGQPTDFRGANLEGAILDDAKVASAVYDCNTRWPAGFDAGAHGFIQIGGGSCGTAPDFSWMREPALLDRNGFTQRIIGDPSVAAAIFNERYLAGASFRGAWLPTLNFVDAELKGADFARSIGEADVRGADLTGADLSFVEFYRWKVDGRTKLAGVKLRGAQMPSTYYNPAEWNPDALREADWHGALAFDSYSIPEGIDPTEYGIVLRSVPAERRRYPDYHLRGADLRGFNLTKFDLSTLDLSDADLRGALLEETNFAEANLSGAKLTGACYGQNTTWPRGFDPAAAKVIHCGYYHRRLEGNFMRRELPPPEMPVPDLAGEDLSEMSLWQAWLPGSNMDKAVLVHTRLKEAFLMKASLRGADLSGAILLAAALDGADLSSASLRGADLRKARLWEANLTDADVTGAVYSLATVWPSGFDPVAAGAKMVTD